MSYKSPQVLILMATFNGERFLTKQLDSLLSQSYPNWKLLIRDDGSTDTTMKILKTYSSKDPRLSIDINQDGPRGACANFSSLFELAKSDHQGDYLMFCDQDDIWKADKIQETLTAMQAHEAQYPGSPVLVYTDLELIDGKDRRVAGALKLKKKITLASLLSFNYVYGCTLMINRKMVQAVGHIPPRAANHDYWLALVASQFESCYLDKKLICYRLHTQNVSGNVIGNNSWASRIRRQVISPEREIALFRSLLLTQHLFLDQYEDIISKEEKTTLIRYLQSFGFNRFSTCYVMLRDHIFRSGFMQSLAHFYQVLFFFRQIRTLDNQDNNYGNSL